MRSSRRSASTSSRSGCDERELWLVRVLPPALEDWVTMVEVHDDIEDAVREAKELADRG